MKDNETKELIYPPFYSKGNSPDENAILNNNYNKPLSSNLINEGENALRAKNKHIIKMDHLKLNNEEKWKNDKYNISNIPQKGYHKDYINVLNFLYSIFIYLDGQ